MTVVSYYLGRPAHVWTAMSGQGSPRQAREDAALLAEDRPRERTTTGGTGDLG
jgi:hypothetical protein